MSNLNAPRLLILSFIGVIAIGTVLLMLPVATVCESGISFVDSLFTATSAVCVTGLIVQDTGTFFTPFGRWVIFFLFQAGGLGIMTFSTFFAVLLGRKLGFAQSDAIRSTLDHRNVIGFKKLLGYIIGVTLLIEIVGALFLFFRWRAITDWSVWAAAEQAVFHSVSAFCNAGFSLMAASMKGFRGDPVINLTMMGLIFLGGIGFIVLLELTGFFRKAPAKRLSLQSRIALLVSGVLVVGGALLLLLMDKGALLGGLPMPERLWAAFFQSVTARTAGFNTVAIGELPVISLFILVVLMFIGASPGSTGGGIKTCTLAIILASLWSMFTGRERAVLFGRSVPRGVVREAFVIFFLSMAWVVTMTMAVLFLRGSDLIGSLFEVTSAFGTVGLSTGITGQLSDPVKLLITMTMFAGRLGPLTLALAISFKRGRPALKYPEETLMVG